MLEALYALAAVGLALLVLRASPRTVLAVYAIAVFALPGPLTVPYTGTNYLTYHHVLVLAGVVRLVLGRVVGDLDREHLRVTAPQVALLGLLGVAFVGGIVLADAGPLGAAGFRFIDLLDQLGFLTVVVVLARQAGSRAVLEAAALGVAVGIAIAVGEHLTGRSWGRFVFGPIPSRKVLSAGFNLAARGGSLRVRAGTEFALQFAWLVVAFCPAFVLVALRRWGALAAALAGSASIAAVYWSYTRSALVAVLVVVAAVALTSRSRGLVTSAVVGAGVAAVAYATVPSVAAHFSRSTASGSVLVRGQRLAPAMDVASRHPFRGTGLGQLITSGFATTDQAFLLEYVELGAIGVAALVLVLAAAVRLWGRAALTGGDRDVAVAAGLGLAAYLASCTAYDAATLVQGTHSLWFVVAGCAAVPAARLSSGRLRAGALRLGLGAAVGLLVGTVISAAAPTHTAVRAYVTTIPVSSETGATFDPVSNAEVLLNTFCGTVTAAQLPSVQVDCTSSFGAAGVALLRVQAPTPFALDRAVRSLTALARDTAGIRYLRVAPREDPRTGQDSWVRTAPAWAALVAAGIAALTTPAAPRPVRLPPQPGSGDVASPARPARRARRGSAVPTAG